MQRNALVGGATGSYQPVAHQLDDEEIQFKRVLESQSDGLDDFLGSEGGGAMDEDLMFDAKDFDRLRMLDSLRDRLKADSEHSSGGYSAVQQDDETLPTKVQGHDDIRI